MNVRVGGMPDDIHALAGAYALDALDDVERARFEAHLDRCPACQEEVDGFRRTAVRLATVSAEPPPPSLRAAVLAEAATVRQEPPTVRTSGRRARFVAPLLAAAAAILLVVAGALVVDARRDRGQSDDIAAVLTAADAQRITLTPTDDGPTGADGEVVWSAAEGSAVVILDGLPALAADRAYALWFVVDGTPRPAGLVTDDDGHAVAVVDAPPAGLEAMGVTDEPDTGSSAPTTPILLLGDV